MLTHLETEIKKLLGDVANEATFPAFSTIDRNYNGKLSQMSLFLLSSTTKKYNRFYLCFTFHALSIISTSCKPIYVSFLLFAAHAKEMEALRAKTKAVQQKNSKLGALLAQGIGEDRGSVDVKPKKSDISFFPLCNQSITSILLPHSMLSCSHFSRENSLLSILVVLLTCFFSSFRVRSFTYYLSISCKKYTTFLQQLIMRCCTRTNMMPSCRKKRYTRLSFFTCIRSF